MVSLTQLVHTRPHITEFQTQSTIEGVTNRFASSLETMLSRTFAITARPAFRSSLVSQRRGVITLKEIGVNILFLN